MCTHFGHTKKEKDTKIMSIEKEKMMDPSFVSLSPYIE